MSLQVRVWEGGRGMAETLGSIRDLKEGLRGF